MYTMDFLSEINNLILSYLILSYLIMYNIKIIMLIKYDSRKKIYINYS